MAPHKSMLLKRRTCVRVVDTEIAKRLLDLGLSDWLIAWRLFVVIPYQLSKYWSGFSIGTSSPFTGLTHRCFECVLDSRSRAKCYNVERNSRSNSSNTFNPHSEFISNRETSILCFPVCTEWVIHSRESRSRLALVSSESECNISNVIRQLLIHRWTNKWDCSKMLDSNACASVPRAHSSKGVQFFTHICVQF